jgi:hypothetical protein
MSSMDGDGDAGHAAPRLSAITLSLVLPVTNDAHDVSTGRLSSHRGAQIGAGNIAADGVRQTLFSDRNSAPESQPPSRGTNCGIHEP